MRHKSLELTIALIIVIIGVILTGAGTGVSVVSHQRTKLDGRLDDRSIEESEKELTENIVQDEPGAMYAIYINWDGFAYHFYEWANSPGAPGTPALNYLASRGVLFTNAHTGLPGTTVPMQTSIVTGAWPAVHGNTRLYYDSGSNTVKQMGRENSSETIAEVVAESGFSSVSVQQFALYRRGTWPDDPYHLYVQPSGSWHNRVTEAIKILKREAVTVGNGRSVIVPEIPRFLAIYADDLDAIGHNQGISYGFSLATNYEAWRDRIIRKLVYMDSGLELLVDALKDLGILDRTAIILTSDHGMSRFEGETSLPDVLDTLGALGYTVEILSAGDKASPHTDIVLVGGELSLQFYFRHNITLPEYNEIIDTLKEKPYFGGYMSFHELAKQGAHPDLGSLLIWAEPPHHFSPGNLLLRVGGHHNSCDESSRRVFMLLSGAGIKQDTVVETPVSIIDVAPTMSHLLGIREPADSMGRVLEEAINADSLKEFRKFCRSKNLDESSESVSAQELHEGVQPDDQE